MWLSDAIVAAPADGLDARPALERAGYANTRQQKRRLLTVQKFATLAPESMPRKVRRQIARDVMKREWKAAK